MSNPLQLFTTRNAKFTYPDGTLTKEAIRTLGLVFDRLGGAIAPSTTDLSQSDDDDSGLEEFKHESGKLIDGLLMQRMVQEPSEVQQVLSELAGLREEVNSLRQQIQGLQEGTTI